MLRSLPAIYKDPPAYLHSLTERYGAVVPLEFGKERFYLLSEPAIIQELLVTKAASFEKFPRVNPRLGVFGNGLLTSEDPNHLWQRRALQPAFNHNHLLHYIRHMRECIDSRLERWGDGETIDVAEEMSHLALEIVCKTMFASSPEHYAREVSELLAVIVPALNQLVLPAGAIRMRLPLPSTRNYFRAIRRLDAILVELIESRTAPQSGSGDMLGLIEKRFDTGEARDQIMTLFIAGHETIGNALAWAWHILSGEPEIQDRIAAEAVSSIDESLDQIHHGSGFEYTRAVLFESLRLYPSVWILGRRALRAVELPGLPMQTGNVALVCMYALHRRPELFHEPEAFRPERWIDARQQPERFSYLPFGAGPRVCIGDKFALTEGILILSSVLRRFRVLPAGEDPPRRGAYLTLRPEPGVRVRLEDRRTQLSRDTAVPS